MQNISQIKTSPVESSEYVMPFRVHYVQNGVSKTWDLVRSHSSVAIIIFNRTRNVLVCVKQFRPGVYMNNVPLGDRRETVDSKKYPPHLGVTLEFCAGIVDKNKSLEEIAAEEVFEECGYKVHPSKLEKIITYRCGVGISGDRMNLYYTEVDDGMKVGEGGGVDTELIEVVELTIDEGRQLLNSEDINAPGEFLFGLLWFLSKKCPQSNS